MSFSLDVKEELCRINVGDREDQIAELAGILRLTGTVKLSGLNRLAFSIATESSAIARKVFSLLKRNFEISAELRIKRNSYLKKNNSYIMQVSHDKGATKLIMDLGIAGLGKDGSFIFYDSVPEVLIKNESTLRAFLRGTFLGGGSISNPEKTYHLEIVTNEQSYAEGICGLMKRYDLNCKVIGRKNSYVAYLKEGENIVDFLNIIGAHNALLNIESIRIMKGMRNRINRLVNCETANIAKVAEASIRQIRNIEYIIKNMGLDKLPIGLREIAEARVNDSEASLKELGESLSTPIGKSGVNHRLRKLDEIAEVLRAERGDSFDE